MPTNLITGGTASADTEYSVDYNAAKACDGNESTRWATTDSVHPHWWKYDFGSNSVIVTSIEFKVEPVSGSSYNVKDFKFQGSNNDSDWTDLYTGQHANNGDYQTFSFSNTTVYRYYRVYITSNWDGTYPTWESITEIMFYGSSSPTTGKISLGLFTFHG